MHRLFLSRWFQGSAARAALVTTALLAFAFAPAHAASLTPPNLTQAVGVADADLFVVWPAASNGPLEGIQWQVLEAQMAADLGNTYLQVSNNLSDVQSPATSRTNLGLGSAAVGNTGASGHVICFLDTGCTWSAAQTYSAKLTLFASTTAGAPFNIPQGVTPTSPGNGDIWLTSTAPFYRINGVTQQGVLAGNNLSDLGSASTARTNLGLGTAAVANTGTSGANVPLLNGANAWSGVQSHNSSDLVLNGSSSGSTTLNAAATASGIITLPAATDTVAVLAATQTFTNKTLTSPTITSPTINTGATLGFVTGATASCLQVNTSGVISGTGTACGSGSGSVGTTGTPASGNLTKFSGAATITNGDLSGDCTTSGTLAITCTKTSGVAFGTLATANAATPPAIGGTTPAAGAFTTLSATSTVSGAGITSLFASPPAIGGTVAAAGSFTTLGASSVQTTTRAAIGVTSTDGDVLTNTTAAANGAQQWSPRLHWSGQGWKTAATAATQSVDAIAEVQPFQGTSNPTFNLVFSGSVNAASYTALFTVPSTGGFNLASGTYQIGGTQIACTNLSNGSASCSTDTTNAANISSGVLAAARGGAGTITGALKGNGSGTVSQAACADLSNGNTACSEAVGTTAGTVAAGNDSRFAGPTQNSQSAGYTFVIGDAGAQIYHPSADTTARAWVIPANGSVAYAVGTKIEIVNDCSAGIITLSITTDTLEWFPAGTTGSRSIAACGLGELTKVTSTKWVLTGVGIS